MKDKKLYDLMNERMTQELNVSYFYFDLETQALNMNYRGFARILANLRNKHFGIGIQYRDLIISLKGLPIGKALEQAREKKFSTAVEIAKAALRKEKEITRETNEVLWYAWDSKEWIAINFLKDQFEKQTNRMNKVENIEFKWSKVKDEVWLDNEMNKKIED